jgi:ABC-type nitrate/sulfonate/bicarbonate transport system ATPase subunit
MDEPFSSLDAPTRESLRNLTLELWSEQALTLVTVTHAIEEAAILGQKILQPAAQPPGSPDRKSAGRRPGLATAMVTPAGAHRAGG